MTGFKITNVNTKAKECSICGGKYMAKGLCAKHYVAAYRITHPDINRTSCAKQYALKKERYLARQAAYDALHPEEKKARQKAWVNANKEKVLAYHLEYQREYRAADPERERERNRKWRRNNLDKDCAKVARRNAQKLKATPEWANEFFIKEAYHLAKTRTTLTGFKWEVDHVVPLRHPLVCGLHVEHNLQVIPEIQNRSKGNHHWPDMP